MIGLTFAGQGGKGGKGGKGKGGHGNHGSHGGPGGPMQKPGGPGSHMQKPGGNEKPNMMMEMMGHMDGLCMDPEMIIKMCVMGTPLGQKMCDAKKKCKKPMKPMKPELEMCSKPKPTGRMFEVIESRKKKPGKKPKPSKKPTKCPSVDDIIAGIAEEMSEEICVFQELGWIDDKWNHDDARYMADIATLPPKVTAALDEDEDFAKCYEEVECEMNKKMEKDKDMKKCMKKMSKEDLAKLNEVGEFMAGTICFKKQLMKACTCQVKSTMMKKLQMLMQMHSSPISQMIGLHG